MSTTSSLSSATIFIRQYWRINGETRAYSPRKAKFEDALATLCGLAYVFGAKRKALEERIENSTNSYCNQTRVSYASRMVEPATQKTDSQAVHRAALTTVWSSMAALLIAISWSILWQLSGDHRFSLADGKMEIADTAKGPTRPETAQFAAYILPLIGIATSSILIAHAQRSEGGFWERSPIAFGVALHPGHWETRIIQLGFLFVAIFLPLSTEAKILHTLWEAPIFTEIGNDKWKEIPHPWNASVSGMLRIGRPNGAQYFSHFTPISVCAASVGMT